MKCFQNDSGKMFYIALKPVYLKVTRRVLKLYLKLYNKLERDFQISKHNLISQREN